MILVGNQIELAMEYIKSHYPDNLYEVEIEIFEDEGFLGGNIDRPQFQRMLMLEREKPFDVLICYRLDRISRNIADFSSLMNELTKHHTAFVSIKEQFDTSTPMGRAMMYIASVFAQLEREVIAERIRDNMIELAKTGRWLGGQTPTGFDSKRFEIIDIYEQKADNTLEKKKKKACKLIENAQERKIIETIFEKYWDIKSLCGLETYLIQHNIRSRTGAYFSTSRLRVLLSNPVYATYDQDIKEYFESKGITIFKENEGIICDGRYGLISYNKLDGEKKQKEMKDWIIAVGLHPGYISGINWIRTQELLAKNSEKRYRAECKNEALFSGVLKCKCGSYMRPKATGNKPKDSNLKRYYYTCELKDRSKGNKCQGQNVVGIEMDRLVVDKIKEIFVPNSAVYEELKKISLSKNTNNFEEELQDLNKIYNKNLTSIKNLVEKLKYIDIDVIDIINQELKNLKQENQEILDKIKKLEKQIKNQKQEKNAESKGAEFILNIINNCFNTFDNLDLKFKKDIIRILIEDIKGNGDKIEVNLLNTKIDESTKKLFSDMIEESKLKRANTISSLEHDSNCNCSTVTNNFNNQSSTSEHESSCFSCYE